jgi:hypothetical protein
MDSLELATYGAGGLFWGREDPQTLSRPIEDLRGHVGVEEQRVTVDKVRFDYVRTRTDLCGGTA